VTLGIGVDYAVNVYARLGKEPFEAWPRALAETGGAVALCSATTIIGYSSLLIADNGALRSLRKVANLGEVACLAAALMVGPAGRELSGLNDRRASRARSTSSPRPPRKGARRRRGRSRARRRARPRPRRRPRRPPRRTPAGRAGRGSPGPGRPRSSPCGRTPLPVRARRRGKRR